MATKAWQETHQEQMKEYRRRHYRANREVYIDRSLKQKADLKAWYQELKSSLKCSRCPESFWACLDFHHKDSKTKDLAVAGSIRQGWSKKRVLKEIAKCEVLCSNCHRKEHHSK